MSRARATTAVGLVLGGLVGLSCGEDPPPVCPTGNCNLPGSTIVKWRFNHYPERGFESDTCSDVGAVNVRVDITQVEDPLITDSLEKGCGEGQLTFVDLAPGTYAVSLTPLAGDGSSLVGAPVVGQVLAGTSASMAPGLETAEALANAKAAADYWAKAKSASKAA